MCVCKQPVRNVSVTKKKNACLSFHCSVSEYHHSFHKSNDKGSLLILKIRLSEKLERKKGLGRIGVGGGRGPSIFFVW